MAKNHSIQMACEHLTAIGADGNALELQQFEAVARAARKFAEAAAIGPDAAPNRYAGTLAALNDALAKLPKD